MYKDKLDKVVELVGGGSVINEAEAEPTWHGPVCSLVPLYLAEPID